MKKHLLRLTALSLCLCLLLCGCEIPLPMGDLSDSIRDLRNEFLQQTGQKPVYHNPLSEEDYIHYDDMEYIHPELSEIRSSYDALCSAAEGEDPKAIMEAVYDFYDAYDWFYTYYYLADIRYSGDMTDTYWEAEYNHCTAIAPEVDAMLEDMNYVLARSPARDKLEGRLYFGEGYFDSYDGENAWDENFTALLQEEAALQNSYYTLYAQAQEAAEPGSYAFYDNYADGLTEILVELIALRQKIAAYYGYSDYAQFAWDMYYYRDYTPAQTESYLDEIRQELSPLYLRLDSGIWDAYHRYCSETESMDYLREMSTNMGGTVEEAFWLMEAAELYDIRSNPNKYDSSFEIYLTCYGQPFLFVNTVRTSSDRLTLAHEFGHFCNDYASGGSYAGVDVMEVFSQGMELLSLCYVEDDHGLTKVKLADSLCVYVEQAAYAAFELEAYRLTGDQLTVENLYTLYDEITGSFGFESYWSDPRDLVTIPHFFTNPMYIVSYVVSNDAAMQLYQLELEEAGAGLARLEDQLDTDEYYFLAFLDSAELESPFVPGRVRSVRDTFQNALF